MSAQRDLAREYLDLLKKTERVRSQIEERFMKGLDPLLAHTGDNLKMQTLSGCRNWWLNYKKEGMTDPPNEKMTLQGHVKVQMIEWDMAAHVASAEVYHDETLERRRKVYVAGARGLRGLTEGADNE